jgi:hypothetical protein
MMENPNLMIPSLLFSTVYGLRHFRVYIYLNPENAGHATTYR